MIPSLADKAGLLAKYANIDKITSDTAKKFVGTPGMLETIGKDTSDDIAKTELETNTDDMVIASNTYLKTNVFSDISFNITQSIASSLLTYIVTDEDDEKYKIMLNCVDYVIGTIKLQSTDIIKSKAFIPETDKKYFNQLVIVRETNSFFAALKAGLHLNDDHIKAEYCEKMVGNFVDLNTPINCVFNDDIKSIVNDFTNDFNIILFTPTEITEFMKNPQSNTTIYLLMTGDKHYDLVEPADKENTKDLTIDNVFICNDTTTAVKLSEFRNQMFGGNEKDVKEVLDNVVMPKSVYRDKIVSNILGNTTRIIMKYLSQPATKQHISDKTNLSVSKQVDKILNEIEEAKFEPPKQSGGGSMHYLKINVIEELREFYLKNIDETITRDILNTILKHSIRSVLNPPQTPNPHMNLIFEKLIKLKDQISTDAIAGMKLHDKIKHIMRFIDSDKDPDKKLHKNLVDCVEKQIGVGCIDGLFVRLGVSTPDCIQKALKLFSDTTQIKYVDETTERSNPIKPKPTVEDLSNVFSEQNPSDVGDIKGKFQQMVIFPKPPDNKYVIPNDIWNIIQAKLDNINDIDGVEDLIKSFIDLCVHMYDNIEILSNNGLFVLFNDNEVMDKINNVLLLFSDLVLNIDLPTCDNPGALTPDIVNNTVVVTPPPKKPSKKDSAELIVFLLEHHLQHMGKPNVVSVAINNTYSHNSLIYEGFDNELKKFLTKPEIEDKYTMEIFTDIVFKPFIGEFKNARYEKYKSTIDKATEQYNNSNTQTFTHPDLALVSDLDLDSDSDSDSDSDYSDLLQFTHPELASDSDSDYSDPESPPPPPPLPLRSPPLSPPLSPPSPPPSPPPRSYGGARTRKYRNVKRNKKTRRH